VRFTLAGDANLDGSVDMADALRLQSTYGNIASGGWVWGNFDYNAIYDSNDAILMTRNYGQSLPAQSQGSTIQPIDTGTTTITPVATAGSGAPNSGIPKPVTTTGVSTTPTTDSSRDREDKQKKHQKHHH
jgi:hypothetical protein